MNASTPNAMLIHTTGIKRPYRPPTHDLERLRNLSALTRPCFRILVFLPTNRIHRITRLTRRHYNSQFVSCRTKIIIRLITQ